MSKIPIKPARLLELQEKTNQRVIYCIELARAFYNKPFPFPEIFLKLKGKKAGVANCTQWELNFNLILMSENESEFLKQVIPHEVAHLIVYSLNPLALPHGREWKSVMEELFLLSAQRTHDFNVSSVVGQTFSYYCDCQKHELSIRRHNQVLKKNQRYICRCCKSALLPAESK